MNPLVAIRRAAWPLFDALIRPGDLLKLAAAIDELDAEHRSVSDDIVATLHALIPTAPPPSRTQLIKLKRDIYNLRFVDIGRFHAQLATMEGLCAKLDRYTALVSGKLEIPAQTEANAQEESRRRLFEIISRKSYQLAVRASSDTLAKRLDRHRSALTNARERDLRSFYAYVCRFATKANPLHLFSSVMLADKMEIEQPYEVIFDLDAILRLEARAVGVFQDKTRIRLQMRPMVRTPDAWEVWLRRADGGLLVARVQNTGVLDTVYGIFRRHRELGLGVTLTVAELESAISVEQPSAASNVASVTRSLIRRGVLVPYLCEGTQSPGESFKGIDESHDCLAAFLDRWHLARVSEAELDRLECEAGALKASGSCLDNELSYRVNAYVCEDMSRGDSAAESVAGELEELRSVFLPWSNFARTQQSNREFLQGVCREHGAQTYLHVLRLFLRGKNESRSLSESSTAHDQVSRLDSELCRLNGQLARWQIEEIASKQRSVTDAKLCFVGPFDFADRVFYINNIFAGEGRFIGRYSSGGERTRDPAQAACVDVELAVPTSHSLHLVKRRFDTGFGFDSRWATEFRYWIEPQQILIRMEAGRPVFVDAVSGRDLRFHYRGGLLATLLPPEYQLLLDGHADFYRNVFAAHEAKELRGHVEHQHGLHYGRVCLRRERWLVRGAFLRTLAGASDVKHWLALRRWIHANVGEDDLWYYRVIRGRRMASKPFILDLVSLESLRVLRNALNGASDHYLELSRMKPAIDGLWRVGEKGYVAELMIEV